MKTFVELQNSPKNWPEDFSHENGNYINTCMRCNEKFLGHKRRVVCKQCLNIPQSTGMDD